MDDESKMKERNTIKTRTALTRGRTDNLNM